MVCVTNIAVAAEIISTEIQFKIGLFQFIATISHTEWPLSVGWRGRGTKTEIISKIAGFVHVVFIGALLFSLFRSAHTSVSTSVNTHT